MEPTATKTARYHRLHRALDALLEDERDPIANAANTAALLYERLPELNWAGFYFRRGNELVLGPFQGRVACVRIPVGRGVCGTCVAEARPVVVENVHQFEDHIMCDAASNAECVVPLVVEDEVVGVLDLDSPHVGRFDDEDRRGLEQVASIFLRHTDLTAVCDSRTPNR